MSRHDAAAAAVQHRGAPPSVDQMADGATDLPAAVPADLSAGQGPDWLDGYLSGNLAELTRLRRHIHANPELGFAERATTGLIAETLAAGGIEPVVLPGGTGVIAEFGSGSTECPVVGFRADIDALPLAEDTGLPFSSTIPSAAHACGHDVHTTVLIGAALALRRAPELSGRVRLIFQPAEEVIPGGAHSVIDAGGVHGVDRLYALHCDPRLHVGQVGLKAGPITSTADVISLTLRGPGGHTSRPHLTADLVGALGTVITGLPAALARRLDPRAVPILVWGAVRAGDAPNAIPQRGTLTGTLRLMDRRAWDGAEALVSELVTGLLAPSRTQFTLEYRRGVPPVDNEIICTELMRSAVLAGLGQQALAVAEQSSGAEDFATYLDLVPGALARLGVWDGEREMADLHSPQFTADERAIPVGVRFLTHLALQSLAAGRPTTP